MNRYDQLDFRNSFDKRGIGIPIIPLLSRMNVYRWEDEAKNDDG